MIKLREFKLQEIIGIRNAYLANFNMSKVTTVEQCTIILSKF